MVYVVLKDLLRATPAEDVIMVIASLQKDMNSTVDLYRANAIRVLCAIQDVRGFRSVQSLFAHTHLLLPRWSVVAHAVVE